MQSDITFILNKEIISTKNKPGEILLDFIRKNKNLTGTKEVCKEGDCGACAVLLGENHGGRIIYKTINSCLYPILKINGKHIVTIEGLTEEELNPLQESFLFEGASQCGFCTPGFIVSITGYLLNNSVFDRDKAINSISGNICRCTGYHSIIRSLENTCTKQSNWDLDSLIQNRLIPSYFKDIQQRLSEINSEINVRDKFSINKLLISGGTDLFVQKPDDLIECDIEIIENLIKPEIWIDNDHLFISGSSTVEDLKSYVSSHQTNLKLDKLFKLFASLPIRNSATLAGNIVNASPIADLTITLLALNAKLIIKNLNGSSRNISLNKFYMGYKTFDKDSEEIIESIRLKIPSHDCYFNFEKVSKRTYLDIASVNTAISIHIENNQIVDAFLSAGGVAPIPLFLENSSNFLIGKDISNDMVQNLIEIALKEISPISDIRGSLEYKSLLLSQLIKAHFLELFPNKITSEVLL